MAPACANLSISSHKVAVREGFRSRRRGNISLRSTLRLYRLCALVLSSRQLQPCSSIHLRISSRDVRSNGRTMPGRSPIPLIPRSPVPRIRLSIKVSASSSALCAMAVASYPYSEHSCANQPYLSSRAAISVLKPCASAYPRVSKRFTWHSMPLSLHHCRTKASSPSDSSPRRQKLQWATASRAPGKSSEALLAKYIESMPPLTARRILVIAQSIVMRYYLSACW